MIGQRNQDEQTESRKNTLRRGTSSGNASNPTRNKYPQVDVHTPEEIIVTKVRSEVMISPETRIYDAVLTSIENLVILRVELAMNSASSHSERSVAANILEPDQKGFLR